MMNIVLMLAMLSSCLGFLTLKSHSSLRPLKAMRTSDNSFFVSELYSGPAAKYNGELVSETLKVVDPSSSAKPDGYVYGAVSGDSTPILLGGLVLSIGLAALIPIFLSVGESAKKQQGDREVENRIGSNQFAIKAREEQTKKGKK